MEIIGEHLKIYLPEEFESVTQENYEQFGMLPGIYFLMSEDELVYIGRSQDIKTRIHQHCLEGIKTFDWFMFLEVIDPWERLLIEELYIEAFQPKYNGGEYDVFSVEELEWMEIKDEHKKITW